jgi:hypothetical protein
MTTPLSSTVPYNRLQQVFCLNLLSNVASSKIGSAEKLTEFAEVCVPRVLSNAGVQKLIGVWTPMWGPVVTEPRTGRWRSVAANTMFVAAQRGENGGMTYVISIAGTDPISFYGWVSEDFDVVQTVPWSSALQLNFQGGINTDQSLPLISQGTGNGLQALLNEMTYEGNSLLTFLTAEVAKAPAGPLEVIVTGHSLGGALSASLALLLADTQGVAGGWDPNARVVVSALPSAGATPGNAVFAAHYDAVLGLRTNRLWNSLDVIPHAWETDLLVQSPHLYFPYIAPNAAVRALVDIVVANTARSNQQYVQINRQTPPLPGQVDVASATAQGSLQQFLNDEVASLIAKSLAAHFGWNAAERLAVQQLIEALLETIEQFAGARGVSAPVLNGSVAGDWSAIVAWVKTEVTDLANEAEADFTALLEWLAQALQTTVQELLQLLQQLYAKVKASLTWLAQKLETELDKAWTVLVALFGQILKLVQAIAKELGVAVQAVLPLLPGVAAFLSQLATQHVAAYPQLLGTVAYADLQRTIRESIPYPVKN